VHGKGFLQDEQHRFSPMILGHPDMVGAKGLELLTLSV